MKIIQYQGAFNDYAILAAMKPDERVVYSDSKIVIVEDSRSERSFFRRDRPLSIFCCVEDMEKEE